MIRNGVFHAPHDEPNALLAFHSFFGQHTLAQLHIGPCFIHHINGLPRQLSALDAAAGVINRVGERILGVDDTMKLLVTIFDPE